MAVVKTTGTYKSSCKKYDIDIFYAVWKDNSIKNPIGVIQLTHGWAEYIERYQEMAEYLAKAGYIVCGQDHLGHGKTCGLANRGVYPPKAGKWMVEDMNTLRNLMQKQYPKLPYMLYGHSLGSLMTRTYISKYGKGLAACVICGTVPIPAIGMALQPICYALAKVFCNFEKEVSLNEAKFDLNPISEEITDKKMDLFGKITTGWLSYDYDNRYTYFNNPYTTLLLSPTLRPSPHFSTLSISGLQEPTRSSQRRISFLRERPGTRPSEPHTSCAPTTTSSSPCSGVKFLS